MAKLIYALVIVAASISFISCSSDEPEGSNENKKSEAVEEYPDFLLKKSFQLIFRVRSIKIGILINSFQEVYDTKSNEVV